MSRLSGSSSGAATQGNLLPSLLAIAEGALTVRHLATTELWWAQPTDSAEAAANVMRRHGFDIAPVREDHPYRYVSFADLSTATRTVGDAARPIDISLLVTPDMPLTEAVVALEDRPYFFVLESSRLAGLITRADLQRPAVSMVLFSLILASEIELNSIIRSHYSNDWPVELSESRRGELQGVYEDRKRHNTEISLLQCLMLEDRLALIRRAAVLRADVGFDTGISFRAWERQLKDLRNVLAHGGGLLDAERDPLVAIRLFNRVRDFAERCWRAAADLDEQ